MLYLPWRRKALALAAVTFSLQTVLVEAIALDYCSNENTGSSSTPNRYNLQSLGHCRDQCGGHAFAITQGKNCWCSDYAPSTSIGTESCSQTCPGYPPEFCGSTDGAFSYIQIGTPSGTGDPFVAAPETSEFDTIVSTRPPSTVFQTIQDTVVSNNVIIRTTAIVRTSVYSPEPETVTQVRTVIASAIPRPSSTSTSTSISSSSSSTHTSTTKKSTTLRPETLTQRVTVSGAVQTRVITTIPSGTALPIGAAAGITSANEGLSNGAVAGITIGVIAAVAIAGLLLFFCCWRKRKDRDSNGHSIIRNSSVLSKAGLLRHGSTRAATGAAVVSTPDSVPRLDTAIPGISGPPSSSTVGMLERRDSRPLFRDQRLNPNVLMVHSDASRTSVGTLQDNEDYSRPLKVANPDQSKP